MAMPGKQPRPACSPKEAGLPQHGGNEDGGWFLGLLSESEFQDPLLAFPAELLDKEFHHRLTLRSFHDGPCRTGLAPAHPQ